MWGSGILNGLRITMRNMLRGPITVRYPYEKIEMPPRFRFALEVVFDEDGSHRCTACMTCARICPGHIIELPFTTAEDKSKHIQFLRYELGACMMCGLCVEACPFDAIRMGKDYELARLTREELTIDLLSDVPAAGSRSKGRNPSAERTGNEGENG